jgi:hypothetical protein
MPQCLTNEIVLPLSVIRWTRKYCEGLRERIEQRLLDRLQKENRSKATLADFQDCLASALEDYSSEKVVCPEPDFEMMCMAMDDLDNGRFQEVDEIIDELQRQDS